jgi:hypothetical protein
VSVRTGGRRLDIFALRVHVLAREEDRFQVRATLQAAGLQAAVATWIGRDEIDDLLVQVERQHDDLTRRLAWETRATPTLRLLWRMDASGHVDGKVEMRDRAEGWSVSVRLKGDQSYLPRIALGLRLLAR